MNTGKVILGIDIGGTNLRMGFVDEEYNLKGFERFPTEKTLGGENPLDCLAAEVRGHCARNGYSGAIAAIALGVPSVVHKNHSYVYSTPNIPGLDAIDLGVELERRLGVPVYVDRDVNFILAHDIRKYDLDPDGSRTILGCYLGTGFGNSLYINGRIHVGSHGVAGELGHIPLRGVTDRCTCGQVGCVETRISGRYLQKLTRETVPDCFIGDVFRKHADTPEIQQFVRDTALPIATEVTLLDPDCVILGSGVFAMEGFPMEALMDEIRRRARHPLPAEDLHFVIAEDSQTAGVLGGAVTVMPYVRMGIPFRS